MAQSLSTPDPSLSPTHLSIRRGRATTTHYTHRQVSLMVSWQRPHLMLASCSKNRSVFATLISNENGPVSWTLNVHFDGGGGSGSGGGGGSGSGDGDDGWWMVDDD